jgi:hypothetical protein
MSVRRGTDISASHVVAQPTMEVVLMALKSIKFNDSQIRKV